MRSRRAQTASPVSLFAFQDIIAGTTGLLIMFVLLIILQKGVSGASELPPPADELIESLSAEIGKLETEIAQRRVEREKQRNEALPVSSIEKILTEQSEKQQQVAELRQTCNQVTAIEARINSIRHQSALLRAQLGEDVPKQFQRKPDATSVRFALAESEIRSALLVILSGTSIEIGLCGTDTRGLANFTLGNGGMAGVLHYLYGQPTNERHLFVLTKPSATSYVVDFLNAVRAIGYTIGFDPLEESAIVQFR